MHNTLASPHTKSIHISPKTLTEHQPSLWHTMRSLCDKLCDVDAVAAPCNRQRRRRRVEKLPAKLPDKLCEKVHEHAVNSSDRVRGVVLYIQQRRNGWLGVCVHVCRSFLRTPTSSNHFDLTITQTPEKVQQSATAISHSSIVVCKLL